MEGSAFGAETFDGGDVFAVQLGQKEDAGIEGKGAVRVGDHDGAGAAIAFVAAFFCAGEVSLFTQPVEEGCCGIWLRQSDGGAVEHKRDLHGGDPAAVPWVQACCLRCGVEGSAGSGYGGGLGFGKGLIGLVGQV